MHRPRNIKSMQATEQILMVFLKATCHEIQNQRERASLQYLTIRTRYFIPGTVEDDLYELRGGKFCGLLVDHKTKQELRAINGLYCLQQHSHTKQKIGIIKSFCLVSLYQNNLNMSHACLYIHLTINSVHSSTHCQLHIKIIINQSERN